MAAPAGDGPARDRRVAGGQGARCPPTVWRCGAVLVLGAAALVAGSAVARAVRDVSARRWAYVGVAAIALLAVSTVAGSQPDEELACNGHAELCDRPYDEVTYAATHNSMSSPDVVPVWPEHDGGLTEQLDAGVRALLIDTHHWLPVESPSHSRGQRAEPTIPPALAAALLDQVVTVRDGRPGVFLCHIHCAFGAQPLEEGLAEVTAFLDANPHEVVTLIIQDDISPAETAAASNAADLHADCDTHPQDPDAAWPTLGELIDRGERLVVFAEEEGPPPDLVRQRVRGDAGDIVPVPVGGRPLVRREPWRPGGVLVPDEPLDPADRARPGRRGADQPPRRARRPGPPVRGRAGADAELPGRQLLRHRRRRAGCRRAERCGARRAGRRRLRSLTRDGCGRDAATWGRMQGWLRRATPTSSATSCAAPSSARVIGLVIGALARAIVGLGSLLIYEIVAGLAGVVLGAILGAFYGGAYSLPRRDR